MCYCMLGINIQIGKLSPSSAMSVKVKRNIKYYQSIKKKKKERVFLTAVIGAWEN